MNRATAFLALACLGACSAAPGSQRVADTDTYTGRQQQIERDVQAILKGMAQVRAENERLTVSRDHAPRQPGS